MALIGSDSKILIISAHPDDEVLGCGGLIAKYSKSVPIIVLLIGEGSTARFTNPQSSEAVNAIKERENYFKQSCQILGLNEYEVHRINCGKFSTEPILNINKLIENCINKFTPSHVFSHYSFDNNNDHRIVSRSTDMATRPKVGSPVKFVLQYEVQSSTDWNFSGPEFQPNVFLPLSENELELKLKAMRAYETEWSKSEISRSPKSLKIQASFRGLQSGFQYAEAYKLIRLIN